MGMGAGWEGRSDAPASHMMVSERQEYVTFKVIAKG